MMLGLLSHGLSDHCQMTSSKLRIKTGSVLSNAENLFQDVTQGLVGDDLFFSKQRALLAYVINYHTNTSLQMYADDTQLYVHLTN